MLFSLSDLPALAIAAVFLYGPYLWCRHKKIPYSALGLAWRLDRRACLDVVLALAVTLVPLTFIAINWPQQNLPRYAEPKTVFYLVLAAISVSIIEETFYRGFMQTLMSAVINKYMAIVITSAIFAASHLIKFPYALMLATFFPGLVMGLLRDKHGNIAPAVLYHFFGNVWSIWFFPSLT